MIGIYKIKNLKTNDFYIGSAININNRWKRHLRDLKKGSHHSIILQRSFDKYGKDNFVLEVLEECDSKVLLLKEQYYLDLLLPKYNICRFSTSTLGRKDTEETKNKKRNYALKNNIKPPKETWENKQIPVVMIDNDKEINIFKSLSEACRFLGKDSTFSSSITRAIKRNIKAYGYNWKYYESTIN